MACDDWLLEQGLPVFRLYRWRGPTLSLGFHQRRFPVHWLELARAGAIDLVRRPSGGGAVLHGFGLTYALIWPCPPAGRADAYRQACQWLQLAFAELGQPLRFGDAPAALGGANCFASSTAADLVDADGHKRVGSAQLWRRGRLLQHGEILLNPPAQLWRQLFGAAAPPLAPLPLGAGELEDHLLAAALRALPAPLRQACGSQRFEPWRATELALIAGRLDRYRLGAEACLASPEACIERTT
jgi:lipoate-protein ligase A